MNRLVDPMEIASMICWLASEECSFGTTEAVWSSGMGAVLFAARGTCSAPRFGALVLTGLDMALWDIIGKTTGRALRELLGGALRESIQYFGFPQGDSAEKLARDAARWAREGSEVIYVKVGRGEALDLAIAEQVRAAIGNKRLRFDANEA